MNRYLITTPLLGFRTWQASDLDPFSAINADPEVMQYFQKPFSKDETLAMIHRMQSMYEEKGYCYFELDLLYSQELIGTIGLGWKTFEADFTPCVDIGWRIHKEFWNQGLASEGASRCLEFAKDQKIKEVNAFTPARNIASIQVMRKIGMTYHKDFDYPELKTHPEIMRCSLFGIVF
ncbi:GNAT family N-acetyltransferase [Algoriphagus hitonicola]|uniref:Protein N-acetyltransferase, RimJ/RimL family n=1 Tax=Algoriphagus hitonicola TaxID=435880 RepID=A0A1I2T1N2_9BACT|nr:GNAT family N-acetyltransferase [Algoriphagus hitonicola]SFG58700.1 Protein N-acetyltransferase, RimJ/RimL family [Algoriphagus hitonicola]